MRRKWVVLLQVYAEVEAEGRDEAKELATKIVNERADDPEASTSPVGQITDVDVLDSYVLRSMGPVQAAAEGRG